MVSLRSDNSPLPGQLVQLPGRLLLLAGAAQWTPACPGAGCPVARCCTSPSLSGCLWKRIQRNLVHLILLHLPFYYFNQGYFECENNAQTSVTRSLCKNKMKECYKTQIDHAKHDDKIERNWCGKVGRSLTMISSLTKIKLCLETALIGEIENANVVIWKQPYWIINEAFPVENDKFISPWTLAIVVGGFVGARWQIDVFITLWQEFPPNQVWIHRLKKILNRFLSYLSIIRVNLLTWDVNNKFSKYHPINFYIWGGKQGSHNHCQSAGGCP